MPMVKELYMYALSGPATHPAGGLRAVWQFFIPEQRACLSVLWH